MTIKEREQLRVIIEQLESVGAMSMSLEQAYALVKIRNQLFYLAEA